MTEPSYNRTYEFLKWVGLPRPFVTPLTVAPRTKYLSYNPTWEDTGEHWGPTVVVRVPLTRRAVGFGYWLDVDPDSVVEIHTDDVEYDAYLAVNDPIERDKWLANRNRAREIIAAHGLDPEDEMALMQAYGVFE